MKLVRLGNSDKFDLIFSDSPNVNAVLVPKCKRVFYDLIHNSIFVESVLNKYNLLYTQIKIVQAKSPSVNHGARATEMTKSQFEVLTHNLVVFYDDEKS